MVEMKEELRTGLAYLQAVTTLMQRVRNAHPTKGLYQAAELQFWWNTPRPTDSLPQLFWFNDAGEPEAAVITVDFSDGTSLVYEDPVLVLIVMPDTSPEWVAHVIERGLAHAADAGIEVIELEVGRDQEVIRELLFGHGFTVKGDGTFECWLEASARSEISSLDEDYRLFSRAETLDRPHHFSNPRRPDVEQRLQQTSLYRADLDLLVLDRDDNLAAYGLFWHDPVTATGVVEPMRTHDDHQQRGLARHLLTSGIELLAQAGAERIAIGYEPDNPASGHLYRSVGFEPHRQTDVFSRGAPSA